MSKWLPGQLCLCVCLRVGFMWGIIATFFPFSLNGRSRGMFQVSAELCLHQHRGWSSAQPLELQQDELQWVLRGFY